MKTVPLSVSVGSVAITTAVAPFATTFVVCAVGVAAIYATYKTFQD